LLHNRIEKLLEKLESEEDKELLLNLFKAVEQAKSFVETGGGNYPLVQAVIKVYDPETVNLYLWTR